MDLAKLLPAVVTIARQAGERIMTVYQTDFDVSTKEDTSPLTAADMAAHETITAGLRELTPELPILSEEAADIAYAERQTWQRYWLVDPLDGTKEFVNRNGEFTVNIALIEGDLAVLGVVLVPARQTCYFAAVGQGAFRQVDAAEAEAITVAKPDPSRALRVVGSRSHADAKLTAYVESLGEHEFIPIGSALKLCLVADGSADLYPRLGLTSEWDTAAAHCVVEQAGGHVMTLEGEPLLYNRKESLLNPFFIVYADRSRDWLAHLP